MVLDLLYGLFLSLSNISNTISTTNNGSLKLVTGTEPDVQSTVIKVLFMSRQHFSDRKYVLMKEETSFLCSIIPTLIRLRFGFTLMQFTELMIRPSLNCLIF